MSKVIRKFLYRATYIDGTRWTTRPNAYCHSPKHRGYLSPKHIKQHKCRERNCNKFQEIKEIKENNADDQAY